MATYKVIQDIEAEDKLVGPLTLRQFVYGGIAAFCIYLTYFVISKGAAFLAIVLVPPALVMGFFAFPWGKEQPTEVWALARIRFMFKPRKRIWDQSGMKELVTITVPKKIEQVYTDGLSQIEVRSRLQALASTIDSRGWAVKNSTTNPYVVPTFATAAASSDRLVDVHSMPQEVPAYTQENYADMLDPNNNKVAEQFTSMLTANSEAHRARLIASMQQPAVTNDSSRQSAAQNNTTAQPDYWFLNQPAAQPAPGMSSFNSQVVTPGASTDPVPAAPISADEEQALVEELRAHESSVEATAAYAHMPTILPLSEQNKQQAEAPVETPTQTDYAPAQASSSDSPSTSPTPPMTDEPDAAILNLSRNDDLNIETLARQAKKAHGDDEVVISLH